jgi:anti-sigma-K factor RskA
MDSFAHNSSKNALNTEDTPSPAALREALSSPDEDLRLSSERRETVLTQAVQAPAPRWALAPLWDFRAVAGAAVAVVLALAAMAVMPLGDAPGPSATLPAAASAADLRVDNSGGHVVLQWDSAESGRHRVIRATDPQALSNAPAHVVEGNTWVDPDTNGARLIFYRVEEAL